MCWVQCQYLYEHFEAQSFKLYRHGFFQWDRIFLALIVLFLLGVLRGLSLLLKGINDPERGGGLESVPCSALETDQRHGLVHCT